jgi:hypothetical protein
MEEGSELDSEVHQTKIEEAVAEVTAEDMDFQMPAMLLFMVQVVEEFIIFQVQAMERMVSFLFA